MKRFTGTVVSTKMSLTAAVLVETKWTHPTYKKIVRSTKKYLSHNTLGANEGDLVEIASVKPISKRKAFSITKILKSATN